MTTNEGRSFWEQVTTQLTQTHINFAQTDKTARQTNIIYIHLIIFHIKKTFNYELC